MLDDLSVNHWSLGGSFMVQKMAITSLIPTFKGLTEYSENYERIFMFDDLSVSRIFGKS